VLRAIAIVSAFILAGMVLGCLILPRFVRTADFDPGGEFTGAINGGMFGFVIGCAVAGITAVTRQSRQSRSKPNDE
jgi:hypothetical protein